MLRVARALDARRRGDPSGQGGFALLMVLGVIALTGVVTAALLGLLLTTMRVTAAHERAAREMRAADGAIEAAIAQMRYSPSGADPCATASPVSLLETIGFDQSTAAPGDDVDVEVVCSPASSGGVGSTSDQVRLVGSTGYHGDVDWAGFPWAATLGAEPDGLGSAQPNLVHSGTTPLQFLSGLTVRRGAAVLGDPSNGGLVASGQYLQGQPGLGGSGTDCGLLTGPRTATWVDDLDRGPECGSAEAADVDAEPTDAMVGFAVDDAEPTVPGCSGSVVTIQPGHYDAARTAQVNALTAGGCTNRTFHFPTGVYSFDADSGTAGDTRHGLVFGDQGSYYVFGEPEGWTAGTGVGASGVAGDPSAPLCDQNEDGATVVLSARTEIHHVAGRVAMCPKHSDSGDAFPAIYQETSVPSGVEVTGTLPWVQTFRCPAGIALGTQSCTRSHTYNLSSKALSNRPLSSARVLVTGTESLASRNNVVGLRTTSIAVHRPNGTLLCTTGPMNGTPNSDLTSSFELRTGGCASALGNETDLTGELRITHSITLGCATIFLSITCASQPMTIKKVEVQTNSAFAQVPSGGVSSPNSTWLNPGNAAADDNQSARPVMPCPASDAACVVPRNGRTPDDPFVHELRLQDFALALPDDVVASDLDPNVAGLRLLMKLVLEGETPREFFAPDMTIVATLTTSSGTRCVSQAGFVNSSQEIAFDLIGPDHAGAGCDAALHHYSQLQGADLNIRFEMPCVVNPGAPWLCFDVLGTGNVIQVRPPSIQHVRLAAATDTYTGPLATSKVNIDATSGTTGSDFHTMGKAWMPLTDVDVHWNGEATGRPLFGGDLVLNGIGSQMAAGSGSSPICCGDPNARTVELTARIDGLDRLRVKVRFNDVDPDSDERSPGHSVRVLDWDACPRVGCLAPSDPAGG